MNSGFGDDLFENGWAASSTERQPFTNIVEVAPPVSFSISSKVPPQYVTLYEHFQGQILTVNDLQTILFGPLIAHHSLTLYQSSRIIDTMYDHNLLPPGEEAVFYQILGLLALELEVAGSGDFVTLQLQLNLGLPPFPHDQCQLLLQAQPQAAVAGPLASSLGNVALEDPPETLQDPEWPADTMDNPLMADHSALPLDPDSSLADVPHGTDEAYVKSYVAGLRNGFSPLVGQSAQIKIKEVPEKEGIFFKHINYTVSHELNLGKDGPGGPRKVVRRYSDFVWLLEFLLKKYPLRVIPGLPPKKFTGTSPDSQFLQKRRRGLHRFLNQLIKHPVFRKEPIVVTFLCVPTDMVLWRKQARIDDALEFTGQKILTSFINTVWPTIGDEFLRVWRAAEGSIAKIIEVWTRIVLLVERHEKRQRQIAYDNSKFVEAISRFSLLDDSLYPYKDSDSKVLASVNQDDTSSINESLLNISGFFNKSSNLLIDESFVLNTTVLEKFKNFLDYLLSLQELSVRARRLFINTIPQLRQRILENEQKYETLSREDSDIKGGELVKLRQLIINDKQEMFQQLNKNWLIKKCCLEEFLMFQETQYLVSEAWINWCKERSQYQQKYLDLYEEVNAEVNGEMPLHR